MQSAGTRSEVRGHLLLFLQIHMKACKSGWIMCLCHRTEYATFPNYSNANFGGCYICDKVILTTLQHLNFDQGGICKLHLLTLCRTSLLPCCKGCDNAGSDTRTGAASVWWAGATFEGVTHPSCLPQPSNSHCHVLGRPITTCGGVRRQSHVQTGYRDVCCALACNSISKKHCPWTGGLAI